MADITIINSPGGSAGPSAPSGSGWSSLLKWGIIIAALAGAGYIAYSYLMGGTASTDTSGDLGESGGLLESSSPYGGVGVRSTPKGTTGLTTGQAGSRAAPAAAAAPDTISTAGLNIPESAGVPESLTLAQLAAQNAEAAAATATQNAAARAAENAALASPGPSVDIGVTTLENLSPAPASGGGGSLPAAPSTPAPTQPTAFPVQTAAGDVASVGSTLYNVATAPIAAAESIGGNIVNDIMGLL